MKKRILAALFSVSMLGTLFSGTALAQEDSTRKKEAWGYAQEMQTDLPEGEAQTETAEEEEPIERMVNLYGYTISEDGKYEYSIQEDGTICIQDWLVDETEWIVPKVIDGKTVTAIETWNFRGKGKKVRKIIVSDGIKKIGMGAFSGLLELEEVKLPEGLELIQADLFSGCSKLKKVTIPSTVLYIYQRAFKDCISLETIYIPKGVKLINPENRDSTFQGCIGLKEIIVDKNNQNYMSYDGCLYDKSGKNLLVVPMKKTEIKFHPKVTGIMETAFDRSQISEIRIPDSVTELKGFQGLENNTVVLHPGVRVIEGFGVNKNVKLVIEPGLEKIKEWSFNGMENCRIRIPESVTDIGEGVLLFSNNVIVEVYEGSTALEYVKKLIEEEKDLQYVVVDAQPLSDFSVEFSSSEYTYNGKAICPEAVVKNGDEVLTPGEDYVIAYHDNVKPGTAKAVIWGKGEYSGKITKTFEIKKRNPFKDVKEGDWFFSYVLEANARNLMTGLKGDTFGPTQSLARAQFAMILWRMNGSPEVEYSDKFPDVKNGDWYTQAVLWANRIGVVNGYDKNGLFGPADKITREQMAVMMFRYANWKYYAVPQADIRHFKDVKRVNGFAVEGMQWAFATKIITGKDEETRLDPQGTASRAECATIIQRFVERYED